MNVTVFGYENNVHPVMYSETKTKYRHRKYHCMYCLQSFTKEEILDQHKNSAYYLVDVKQLTVNRE